MGSRKKSSSRRSSSSSKPPEYPVYLVDQCLGGRLIVERMTAAGEEAHQLIEILPQDSPDPIVIAEVAKRGWVLLTRDKRIRHRENEREAVVNSKIAVFLAPGGKTFTGELVADAIVKARHRMRQWLAKNARPFVARISPGRQTGDG